MDRADAVYSVSNTPNGKVEMGINQVSSVGGAHLSPETDNTYHHSRGAKSRVPQRERERENRKSDSSVGSDESLEPLFSTSQLTVQTKIMLNMFNTVKYVFWKFC